MKTSSVTPPRHIITCCIQFNAALVQQCYRKTKSSPICTCFLDTEIPLTQWKWHIATVYLKNRTFIKESYMWVGITAKPFSGFCHVHFLIYPLLQHAGFQKQPVSYAGDVCDKTFSQKSCMKTHQFIHAGQRLYASDLYDKTFSQKSRMKRHQLIHTGQHPYDCELCDKTFSQKSCMKTHQLIRTGQRPYACDLCDKTFSQKTHMKRHQLIYSSQCLYVCDVCNETFSQKSNMKKHQLIHSG